MCSEEKTTTSGSYVNIHFNGQVHKLINQADNITHILASRYSLRLHPVEYTTGSLKKGVEQEDRLHQAQHRPSRVEKLQILYSQLQK
jgi:hypothetical protein